MPKQTIAIIGGGVSGLMAARELADDYRIILLEAQPRLGGRIHTQQAKKSSHIIEAGAEFIHGELPVTFKLLKEAGIEHVQVEGNVYRKQKGRWEMQNEFVEGWDQLISQMKKVKNDITMHNFLEQYYAGEQYAGLRRHVTAFAEGFDIADIKKVSVRSLYEEWSAGEQENFRIPAGYGTLVDFLQKECVRKRCQVLTSQLVKQIDWEKNKVTIYTTDEQKYYVDKVIITVPLHVLQQVAGKASINFTPPIDSYAKLTEQVGYGTVIKVILAFQKRFWQGDAGFILSDEPVPTWWTQLPDTSPILTGWVGGPKAEKLSQHSEEDILEKALLSLASIFDVSIDELKQNMIESFVFNWQNDEFALGAYSYAMPGSAAARESLKIPIDNTIFFAGEALYDGPSGGTVEAALVSGKEVAVRCRT